MSRRKSIPPLPPDLRESPGRAVAQRGAGTQEWDLGWTEARWLMAHHIVAVGISRARRGFRFANRAGKMATVMACVSGSGWAAVDGGARPFGRGQVYRMPAYAWQAYWAERAPWTVAWVCIAEDPARTPAVPGPTATVVDGDGSTLVGLLEALRAEAGGARDHAALGHLCALVDLAARRLAGSGRRDDGLDGVWRAVEADPARPWRLGDLARLAGCGVESLRVACAQRTGRSPMAQVTYLRMRRAAILLADPQATVAGVAESVGYGNAFAFSTAFKRWMNMAPAIYQGRRSGAFTVG
jgi:AraC-like DNA-binding protein